MKRLVISITLLVFFTVGQTVCYADSIPNLVGTWSVCSEGVVLFKGDKASKHDRGATNLDKGGKIKAISNDSSQMTIIITEQKGRIFYGIKRSEKSSEEFAGVIGFDNKSIHCVDHDGFNEGIFDNKNDKIDFSYSHANDNDSIVVVGTWTRIK